MPMWRIRTSIILFAFGAVIIIARLFYWQILSYQRLSREANKQHFVRFVLPSQRGSILTSDGYPLVMSKDASLVYASPKEIVDVNDFVRKVSAVLQVDEASVSAQLAIPQRVWIPIAHKVDGEVIDRLKALQLKGLGFESEPKRFYPEASMAAQLLGFVGSDQNGNDKGYFGIEGFYDRELHGKDGSMMLEKDVSGAPILSGNILRIEPENGRNLVLWLDRTIQSIVEKRLLLALEKYGAKSGTVTVMDPSTGGILAMASLPSYDPRSYWDFEGDLYKNPVVAATFEPGSTFKAVIMASGLHEKVITPQTKIHEDGPVQVSGYDIRTWNNKYAGLITMTDVLIHSSNVGMVSVMRSLGDDKFLRAIKAFGFGDNTNIDLEDEASATLRAQNQWKEIDLATASFGQGIAVTPIQMIRAVGALANNGMLTEPRIVKEIHSIKGDVSKIPIKNVRRVISEQAAVAITDMMVATVDKGEAKWAKPKGYRIAGKTGTAQIPIAGHYDDKKTIASFVGFAPADNPKFVMLVTLTEPTSSPWGSETAAPLFFSIAKDLFVYWGISANSSF